MLESERVEASVPFIRFRVLRALETGDVASAEGRDRVIDELSEVLLPMGPSAEREELRRIAADRLSMSPELLEQRLPRGSGRAAASAPRHEGRAHGVESSGRELAERSFLALCIAVPDAGAVALAELDLDADLTSALARRAAQQLREHLDAPTAGLADDDPLLRLMRELAVGDERTAAATPEELEIERLNLTLARLEREIAAARVSGGDISELAARKAVVKQQVDDAVDEAMYGGSHGARM